MTEDNERKAFEEWMLADQSPGVPSFERAHHDCGIEYVSRHVDALWAVWKARSRLAPKGEPVWFVVDKDNVYLRRESEEEAKDTARHYDRVMPRYAPHRVVPLYAAPFQGEAKPTPPPSPERAFLREIAARWVANEAVPLEECYRYLEETK